MNGMTPLSCVSNSPTASTKDCMNYFFTFTDQKPDRRGQRLICTAAVDPAKEGNTWAAPTHLVQNNGPPTTSCLATDRREAPCQPVGRTCPTSHLALPCTRSDSLCFAQATTRPAYGSPKNRAPDSHSSNSYPTVELFLFPLQAHTLHCYFHTFGRLFVIKWPRQHQT